MPLALPLTPTPVTPHSMFLKGKGSTPLEDKGLYQNV